MQSNHHLRAWKTIPLISLAQVSKSSAEDIPWTRGVFPIRIFACLQ
ncbi:MAG TPA: hypothetical protein VJK54_06355 [Chthoniobacterales bacterium]|nr:hypothetical protein [Chthoniobacterales bacterium]